MAAFCLRLDLAIECSDENECSDLSIFFFCFELSNKISLLKKGPILSVEKETIVGNVNLVSNLDYNHSAIIKIYGRVGILLSSSNSRTSHNFFHDLYKFSKTLGLAGSSNP